jgi:long-chain fatty acid transport protein
VTRTAAAVAAAAIAAAALPAEGSPLFELVGDPEGRGGLTARVTTTGPAAAYFNPALLADTGAGFHLGLFFLVEEIGVVLDGRSSSPACRDRACDVAAVSGRGPESFRHGDTGDPIRDPSIPTEWLEYGTLELDARPRQAAGSGHSQRAYQTVGLVTQVFRGRVSLGLFAMIPLGDFTTAKAFYNDEREQYFSNSLHPELYSDRTTATSLAFGGGIRVHRDVSVGATFTLSLANRASAPVYVSNLSDLDTVLLDSDIAVEAAVAPHFGVSWRPRPEIHAAATIHTPQAFEIDTGFDYVLATGQQQTASVQFTHAYMPLTIAAGGSYALGRSWTATALATWARWSRYRDRHGERPSGNYAWSDTITASAGARWGRGRTHAWLDAIYQPSPVPPQTGRSNYVDNDRAGVSAGADWETTLWGSRVKVGVTAIGHRLFEQHVTKFTPPDDAAPGAYPELVRDEVPDDAIDVLGAPVPNRVGLQTNNPGFPGFGSRGWVLGGGINVTVHY